ncbi:Methionyl-tRNA formyltransferase, mitochondrial [Eumeta japonica]|uniref:Methionyl-tRNA formyltransferase, mitochondrial n=1 Tax=Eumeta variegata TaxID=151549 RepID=A0A4C1X9A7_EUMVA|nr:Methionyl-tRNA formyltransferase, mitochondrial [Eumeta japonica]
MMRRCLGPQAFSLTYCKLVTDQLSSKGPRSISIVILPLKDIGTILRGFLGEIIEQQKVPISKDIKLPELTEQLSDLGAKMLVKCIKTLPNSLTHASPQPSEGVTYARKISKDINEVRWSEMTAQEVYNLYRAVYGLYQLVTNYNEKRVKLFDAFLCNENQTSECTLKEIDHFVY